MNPHSMPSSSNSVSITIPHPLPYAKQHLERHTQGWGRWKPAEDDLRITFIPVGPITYYVHLFRLPALNPFLTGGWATFEGYLQAQTQHSCVLRGNIKRNRRLVILIAVVPLLLASLIVSLLLIVGQNITMLWLWGMILGLIEVGVIVLGIRNNRREVATLNKTLHDIFGGTTAAQAWPGAR